MKRIAGSGTFGMPCAGTSYRQEEISSAVGAHDGSYLVQVRSGELSPDEANEHDANALKVMLGQRHIGWVPQAHSESVKNRLHAAGWDGADIAVDMVVLNGQALAGKTYNFFAELDIPTEGPIKIASVRPGGGNQSAIAKWSQLIPTKSGAFRCVTFVDPEEVLGMSLGDVIDPWAAPHWDTVNYYRDTNGVGLGTKILQIGKGEHRQAFGDKRTTGTLVDIDGRFYTFELAPDGDQPAAEPIQTAPVGAALPHGIAIEDGRFIWGGCYFRTLEQAVEYAERHKGIPPPSASRSQEADQPGKPFKWWLWGPVGAVGLFLTWALMRTPSPEEDAKFKARYAIELCWKQQERKSLDPGAARFVAGACEQMEADFRRKYGVNP